MVAARYGPTTGNFTIPVYYCAEEGKYSESDLAAAVQTLNEEVTAFFSRVSSGQLEYNFVAKEVVSPDSISWDTVNLAYLRDNLPKSKENPCFIEAIQDARSDTVLVLADMLAGPPTGGVLGYAIYGGGPSIVITEERHADIYSINSRQRYLNTVAHELGHSLLNLCHTHESSAETDRYKGVCPIEEEVHGKRYDRSAFQDYHNNYIFHKDDISVMSYQFAMSAQEKNSYTLASDYISCRQLYTKELDLQGCNGAEVIDPDHLAAPLPPEPEGSPPESPTDLAAAGLDGAVVVKWSPPFDDGGSPLTGYLIEYSNGTTTEHLGPISDHTYVIDGLTNGVEYRIGVRAVNEIGTSETATVSATPQGEDPVATLPGPVVGLTAASADRGGVRVNWSPPSDDGGSAITGYSVLYRPTNREWVRWPHSGTSTNVIITGLADGTVYEIEITARNIVGHGRSEYTRASTLEAQCDAPTGEHRHAPQNLCHSDHPWSASNPPPCVVGQARDYTYHDPNSNNRHITGTVTACPDDPELSVRSGSVIVDDGTCPAIAGCRWIVGSGSGWPSGEQFWIRCGSFVDTQQNRPVTYYDRFVEDDGTLWWGESICYTANRTTVEVWTSSGVRKTVTVQATQPPDPPDDPEQPPDPPEDPELSVRSGSVIVDDGTCPASAGCRWIVGSGSGWPAGEQFWIRCGSFVDTQQNRPVTYYDRFVEDDGTLWWGESICYTANRTTVEVWTSSGVRKTVTVQATQPPDPPDDPEQPPDPPEDPELSVRSGSVIVDDGTCPASAGCRWIVGSGSGWPAGEQFWIRCGSFVDTQQNRPVTYYDRFVEDDGTLWWGESICYTANRTTVEVWTSSGVRKTVTITP